MKKLIIILNFENNSNLSSHAYFVMAKVVVKEIKENFAFYKKLLEDRKSIFDKVIDIKDFANNSHMLQAESTIQHVIIKDRIILMINVKINDHNFFQFKLRCKSLCDTPFFRYDSDGASHRNYDANIPLAQQQITTPHFHYFNEHGVSIAYKTDKLLNKQEKRALEDINLCIAHFFHECNIVPDNDLYPTILINSSELPLDFSVDDPLTNINF